MSLAMAAIAVQWVADSYCRDRKLLHPLTERCCVIFHLLFRGSVTRHLPRFWARVKSADVGYVINFRVVGPHAPAAF